MTDSCRAPDLLDAALAYADRGWTVIPVAGKRYPADWGGWKHFQQKPPHEGLIAEWFGGRFPEVTGVAVLGGRASGGLAVRDFDAADAYRAWAHDHPAAARRLPTVRTARGFHVYGRLTRDAYRDLGDGELRADPGHFVLAPPSRHPSGTIYAWLNPLPDTLPPLPASLRGPPGTAEVVPTAEVVVTHSRKEGGCRLSATGGPFGGLLWLTLPGGPGLRNAGAFLLARRLKALLPGASLAELRPLVAEWWRLARPNTSGEHGWPDVWDNFTRAWAAIHSPCGVAVTDAYDRARQAGGGDPAVLEALCRILAGADGRFFLGCRTVAGLFGVSHKTAHRWLARLEGAGVLRRTLTGSLASKKANEWIYSGELS